jgi:hypothetical protein
MVLPLAIGKRRAYAALAAIIASALLIGSFLAARSWLAAHDAAVRLAATLEVQEHIRAQASDRQRRRNAVLAETLAGIGRAKRRVDMPALAALEIPQILPALPQPLLLDLYASTPEDPEPPATALIPQSDLKPIYDYWLDVCLNAIAWWRGHRRPRQSRTTWYCDVGGSRSHRRSRRGWQHHVRSSGSRLWHVRRPDRRARR